MFSYLAVKCKSTNKLPKSAANPLTNYLFYSDIDRRGELSVSICWRQCEPDDR